MNPLWSQIEYHRDQWSPVHHQEALTISFLRSQVQGVLAVHEFHIWQLAGNRIIASAHIRCQNLIDYMRIAEDVKSFFHNEGIHSTTIQPEFTEVSDKTWKQECNTLEFVIVSQPLLSGGFYLLVCLAACWPCSFVAVHVVVSWVKIKHEKKKDRELKRKIEPVLSPIIYHHHHRLHHRHHHHHHHHIAWISYAHDRVQ